MKLKSLYMGLSIKYKILIFFCSVTIMVSLVIGFYSYSISQKNVISKVSAANLGVIRQINTSLNFLQNDINDISTYMCIDSSVQSTLGNKNALPLSSPESQLHTDSSLKFIMNLIASKSYISLIILYGDNMSLPYGISTDYSNGIHDFSEIKKSPAFEKASNLRGSPLWVNLPQGKNIFLENNRNSKIALCRVVKDYDTYNDMGFLVIGVNEDYVKEMCSRNIQSNRGSLVITGGDGNLISRAGSDSGDLWDKVRASEADWKKKREGSFRQRISGRELLITYSSSNSMGWKVFYAIPLETLTGEINSIKFFTFGVILACLLLLMPLMILISSFLTYPIRSLLKSMKKFQEGNFDERVEIRHYDEIGKLAEGYNNMVSNIKELIHKAYILQIKEREAELNALQAQINPHFLYNTLDTIFWKAERQGQQEISDMVYSLSKLFRLSLNMGRGKTLISREKELIEHYLTLQKMRFKNKLNYEINIDNNISNFVIPKLILQPFVENAILHGIEGKENGGMLKVTGTLDGKMVRFVIEDNGAGMDEQKINKLLFPVYDEDVKISSAVSGGYAIRNVNERLRLNFNNDYSLNFKSEPGKGTVVEIRIPAHGSNENQEVRV